MVDNFTHFDLQYKNRAFRLRFGAHPGQFDLLELDYGHPHSGPYGLYRAPNKDAGYEVFHDAICMYFKTPINQELTLPEFLQKLGLYE